MSGPGAAAEAGAGVDRAGGGEACGPSGCCADAGSDAKAKVAATPMSLRVRLEEGFIDNSVICLWDAGIVPHGCSRDCGIGGESLILGRTHPSWFSRKNVNRKELRTEITQGCDSRGVMKDGWRIEGFAWFQNGKNRAGVTLYTR